MTESNDNIVCDRDYIASKIHQMMKLSGSLDDDIICTNDIHYDLQTMHNRLSRELVKETTKLKKLIALRRKYYLGQMPPEYYVKFPLNIKINTKEVGKIVENDELVVGQSATVDEIEVCLNIIEDSKKRLSFRTNDIKTIIEYRKFQLGVN